MRRLQRANVAAGPSARAAALDLSTAIVASAGFVGEWKDGKAWSGSGLYATAAGHAWDGAVRHGIPFEGKGVWVNHDGTKFRGEVADGWPISGKGVHVSANNAYDGIWEDGTGSGRINCMVEPLVVWEGEWRALDRALDPVQLPVCDIMSGPKHRMSGHLRIMGPPPPTRRKMEPHM